MNGSPSGGSSSSSGGSSSPSGDPFSDDDYAGLSDADLAALVSDENDSKAAMSAKTSAAAFFALLGVCALSLFFLLRWWRARNARLRRLAFEREMALDAAEEDIAETGKIRRSTLFALANVDAEATAYGEDLAAGPAGGKRTADGRDYQRGKKRFFSPLARLNPFGFPFGGRDRGDEKQSRSQKRGAEYRYSAARVARAASGVLPARMSVHADRLDRLERLSRARGASRALPRKGSRFEPRRRRLGVSDDSDSDSDAERLTERLNDAPASSDDRGSRDDEEAAFESAVLAAARRASRFERDRLDRRRDESQRATRHKTVSREDDDDDDGAADASAHAALLSDVIVDTDERGEAAKRRWKMFRGNGDGKP
jgi:hypothetical protein